MGLYIQKFGGSSLATVDLMRAVAERICHTRAQGHDVVVVLSAMGDATDTLIERVNQVTPRPSPREYDAVVATGEQISTALLSLILNNKGCAARSLTGQQAGIATDAQHKRARIHHIDTQALQACLDKGCIPIVAGFQGVNAAGDTTTLGRGGSDTTAVALAAALSADECQIFTDVEGVYTTDPRMVPNARLLSQLTYEEMLELSSLGAKVLQIRSVEMASKYSVPIRVCSSFNQNTGTLIRAEDPTMEQPLVSGIAFDRDQAKLSIQGIPDQPGIASKVLGAISKPNIEVDMIVQNAAYADGRVDISFTVRRDDYEAGLALLQAVAGQVGAASCKGDNTIAKLSIVGVGMQSHAGVAVTMFEAMAQESINIQMVSTSEIKTSLIIDEKYLELGVRTLHTAFGLNTALEKEKTS